MYKNSFWSALAIVWLACACCAQNSATKQADYPSSESLVRFFHNEVRLGLGGVIYHPGANVSAGGAVVPGASATVTNNVTLLFDYGRYFTPNLEVSLMGGIPPRPKLSGSGTIAPYGQLGAVWYGPAVLSGNYHFLTKTRIQPYVGPGIAYAIILRKHAAALSNIQVHNNFAPVAQAGANYMMNKKWGAYIDCKQIWLSVDAHGKIAGIVPAQARVKLYPTVISSGLTYRF